jgi:hypothetical protein
VAILDLPPQAQQRLEEEKVNLGSAEVPEGLGVEKSTAVERAIDEAFVAGFRTAMFVAAGLALMSAVAAAILIEGKRQAVRSEEARRTESETAPA